VLLIHRFVYFSRKRGRLHGSINKNATPRGMVSSTQTATQTFLGPGFGVIFVVAGKIKFGVAYKLFEVRNRCFKQPAEVVQFRAHHERNLLSENREY
jgi:hypothetical protein